MYSFDRHRSARPPRAVLAATMALLLLLMMVLTTRTAAAAEDHRSRLVESSLKDLAARNDADIASGRITQDRGVDSLGNPRVILSTEPRPTTDALVGTEIQSSLHRLRRETVSRQTADGRESRVDESLDRAANDP